MGWPPYGTFTRIFALIPILIVAFGLAAPNVAYESEVTLPPKQEVHSEKAPQTQKNETKNSSEVPAILEKIAFCESGGKHFDKNGNVIRGIENPADVGKYQINMTIWGSEAEKLGIDPMTEEGNKAMALLLYNRYGTDPWVWSKKCWNK